MLITKWVGQAWEELSQDKDMTIRAFRKCGVSVASDGSDDFCISIEGLSDYTVDMDEDIDDSTSEQEQDPFADLSDNRE